MFLHVIFEFKPKKISLAFLDFYLVPVTEITTLIGANNLIFSYTSNGIKSMSILSGSVF